MPNPDLPPICYSTDPERRAAFVQAHLARLGAAVTGVVYLIPKKFHAAIHARWPAATVLTYEDLTKSNAVFNLADDHTLLILDRVARYKNITTDTFVRLSRASAQYRHKILVDIVPCTGGIPFLYPPLALIDRAILGYQHWYSYRENNLEQTADGRAIRAHDPDLLAAKLADWVDLTYTTLLPQGWETIACPLTAAERRDYGALRDDLFATRASASPIITTLADWTNIRPSRYAVLRATVAAARGPVVVYTNLAAHNRRLGKILPGVEIKSFYDANGDEDRYATVILAELPITKSYLFLDVLANIRPTCRVCILRSDTTVDTLLYQHVDEEITGINALATRIHAHQGVTA